MIKECSVIVHGAGRVRPGEPVLPEVDLLVGRVGFEVGFATSQLMEVSRMGGAGDRPQRNVDLAHVRAHENPRLRPKDCRQVGVLEWRVPHERHEVDGIGFAAHGGQDTGLEPEWEEFLVEDAAGIDQLLIQVDVGSDGNHCLEVRRAQTGGCMLNDCVVRHTPKAHIAVGPWLHSSPLDSVTVSFCGSETPDRDLPRVLAGTRTIDAHHHIVMRHPVHGVDRLVVLKNQALGVALEVALLCRFVRFETGVIADGVMMERAPVHTAIHDNWILSVLVGAEDVGVDI